MRDADAKACAQVGADTLMRAAGRAIAGRIEALVKPGKIVAFAGPGNNGGDAFAALAELDSSYHRIICAAYAATKSDARRSAEGRALASGVAIVPFPQNEDEARALVDGAALALDGLLGIGGRLPLSDELAVAVVALDANDRPVIAIDVPSGCDALDGSIAKVAVRATETVTLGAYKPGLLLEPARTNAGVVSVATIGIDPAILHNAPRAFATTGLADLLALLPQRIATGDKRTSGAPLIIAGSSQFPGAAVLCARAAARAGAGYVTVATSSLAAHILRYHLIEQVVVTIDDERTPEDAADTLLDIGSRNGAIAIGPGLGLDDRTGAIVRRVLERTHLPCVIDASALFHLAKHLELLRGKPVVVTPHEGEFARLSGKGSIAPGQRVARIREFVERTGITTLLKGADTLIYDGTTMYINASGTTALATAGTGDVLTGMISTLLSQGLAPVDAARAAAYWHGRAAQKLAVSRPVGLVAGDIPEALADAIRP